MQHFRVIGVVLAAASWMDGAYALSALLGIIVIAYSLIVRAKLLTLEERVDNIEGKTGVKYNVGYESHE